MARGVPRMLKGLPKPPERPHEDECCHRNCDPCIMDYYDVALDRWRERVADKGFDPETVLAAFNKKRL